MTTDKIDGDAAPRKSDAVTVTTKLKAIATLDPAMVTKLATLEILDNATLLERGSQPEGRAAICAEAGIDQVHLLQTLYLMDLERVDGVSWMTGSLLTAAGVTTVPDLAFRVAEDLLPQLQRANAEVSLVKRLPTAKAVKGWIEHARGLPQAIFFEGNTEVY